MATVAQASPATARLVSHGRLLREYGSANDVRSASTLTPVSLTRAGPTGPSGQPYRRAGAGRNSGWGVCQSLGRAEAESRRRSGKAETGPDTGVVSGPISTGPPQAGQGL
ncbi:hypothetical protein Misp05_28700 [Micromonospora sp. NBRC 107095]|nr:hypothetical protein Misp05_28700 [Micromonospora sp. NBRC 107095]